MYNTPPPLPLEYVQRIVELALKYKSRGVVAVDIAGNELLPLDPRHIQGFLDAKANGLHITIHAGESGPAANVRQVWCCPHFRGCMLCTGFNGVGGLKTCPY